MRKGFTLREAVEHAVIFDDRDNLRHVLGRATKTAHVVRTAARERLEQLERGAIIILPNEAENIARLFHENYERLASDFGYVTRKESAVTWPPPNAALMVATVDAVLDALRAAQPQGEE